MLASRRWPLATCGLGGVCKHGLSCKTPPRPHTSRSRAIWRFLSPDPGNRGYPKYNHPHGWVSEEKSPSEVVSAGKLDSTGPGKRSPRQAAGPSLPWASTRAQRGCCRRAPAVFPNQGGHRPGFVCIESAGSVRPGPTGTEGQRGKQGGEWVGGGGQRLNMQGWRSGWGGVRAGGGQRRRRLGK